MSHVDHGGMSMPMSPGSMSNGSMNSAGMGMAMHMSFYWGKDAIILFSGWPERSSGMYVLALFFVLLLGIAIEVLSVSPAVKKLGTKPLLGALAQACVHAVRMTFAYMVMLSVMSYNIGIFIAAVAGHAVGFFIVKARALSAGNRTEHSLSTDIDAAKV